MDFALSILPLVVIIAVLAFKKHMLLAGLLGGIVVVVIAGVPFSEVESSVVGGFGTMFGSVAPILYAAAAAMAAKGGCFNALVALCEKLLRGKYAILAAVLVLVEAFATYMAGMSAGNTMVIAPLVFAAIGAAPEVIAAMAIAGATCFICSPAGTQAVVTAENIGIDVTEFASIMLPFAVVFVVLAALLAFWGVRRRGTMIAEGADEKMSPTAELAKLSNVILLKRSVPVIVLLILVVFGGMFNAAIGTPIVVPVVTVCLVSILMVVCTDFSIDETCKALVSGSQFILTTLFAVGIFLGFINLMDAQMGTFANLASLASAVPSYVVLPVAMVLGFLIAIPSGAFCAGVLALILPTLALMGFSPIAMGFIALATGMGTQISPVQINVAALSDGFNKEIMEIVKNNIKYMGGMLVILIAVALVFA